jgi:hypothetical protein
MTTTFIKELEGAGARGFHLERDDGEHFVVFMRPMSHHNCVALVFPSNERAQNLSPGHPVTDVRGEDGHVTANELLAAIEAITAEQIAQAIRLASE